MVGYSFEHGFNDTLPCARVRFVRNENRAKSVYGTRLRRTAIQLNRGTIVDDNERLQNFSVDTQRKVNSRPAVN